MSIQTDYEINQGSFFSVEFTFNDENGAPIDLTGYTFRGSARWNISDPDPALNFDFQLRNQSDQATKGKVLAALTSAKSSAVKIPGNFLNNKVVPLIFDFERVAPDLEVFRFREGTIKLSRDVTRP